MGSDNTQSSADHSPTPVSTDSQVGSVAQLSDTAQTPFEKFRDFEHASFSLQSPSLEKQARRAIEILQTISSTTWNFLNILDRSNGGTGCTRCLPCRERDFARIRFEHDGV